MATITQKITLSTTESNYVGLLKFRHADENTQLLDVTITENGLPKSFEGLTPFFCLMAREITGQGVSEERVNSKIDSANGNFQHILSANAFQMIGKNEAYFSFRSETASGTWVEQFSTRSFVYVVEKSIYSQPFKDSNYWFTFDELYRKFQRDIESANLLYDDSKSILESIDPGGKILSEINNFKNRKEAVNVLDLGLKNDGSEDVTDKLRQYIEAVGNDISLFFPAGIYKMTNNLLIDRKMTMKGVKPRYDNGNLTAGTVFSGGGFYFRNGSNGTVIDSVGIDATKGTNGFDIRGGVKDVLISNVLTIAKEHCYLFESYTGMVDNIRVVNSESYDAVHGFISKAANIIFDGCVANNHASWGFGLISDNIQGANKLAEAINNKVNNCTAKNCGAGYMQYKRNYFADDSNALKNTNNQLIGINAIKCTIPIRVGDSPGDTGGGKYVSYPVDNTSISNFAESESAQSAQFYQSTNLIINSATLSRDAVATNQANKNIIASNYVGGTIGYVNDLQAISGAAPSLKFGKTFITKNTSATIITDFVDAIDGEIYEIMLFDRFTTIQSSKTIALNFGTVSDRGSSVRFKYQDGIFFEISRANAPRKNINARLETAQSFEIGNAEVLDLVANAGAVMNGIKITDAASNKSLLTIVVRIGSSGTLYYSFDASQFVLPEGIKTEITGFGNAQVFVWAYIQALNKYVLVSSRDTKIN